MKQCAQWLWCKQMRSYFDFFAWLFNRKNHLIMKMRSIFTHILLCSLLISTLIWMTLRTKLFAFEKTTRFDFLRNFVIEFCIDATLTTNDFFTTFNDLINCVTYCSIDLTLMKSIFFFVLFLRSRFAIVFSNFFVSYFSTTTFFSLSSIVFNFKRRFFAIFVVISLLFSSKTLFSRFLLLTNWRFFAIDLILNLNTFLSFFSFLLSTLIFLFCLRLFFAITNESSSSSKIFLYCLHLFLFFAIINESSFFFSKMFLFCLRLFFATIDESSFFSKVFLFWSRLFFETIDEFSFFSLLSMMFLLITTTKFLIMSYLTRVSKFAKILTLDWTLFFFWFCNFYSTTNIFIFFLIFFRKLYIFVHHDVMKIIVNFDNFENFSFAIWIFYHVVKNEKFWSSRVSLNEWHRNNKHFSFVVKNYIHWKQLMFVCNKKFRRNELVI